GPGHNPRMTPPAPARRSEAAGAGRPVPGCRAHRRVPRRRTAIPSPEEAHHGYRREPCPDRHRRDPHVRPERPRRICRPGRRRLGVVVLAARDAPADTIAGLTFGGDDSMTKPFSVDELVARVRAVLRRIEPVPAGDPEPGVLRLADVELDERACQVRRAGEPVALSPTEFKL